MASAWPATCTREGSDGVPVTTPTADAIGATDAVSVGVRG